MIKFSFIQKTKNQTRPQEKTKKSETDIRRKKHNQPDETRLVETNVRLGELKIVDNIKRL